MAMSRSQTAKERVERLADILLILQRCFIQRLSEKLARGRISFAQYFLLAHVAAHDGLSMGDIAARMNHSTAATTGLVHRLENLGHLRRAIAPRDRRKSLVTITQKGRSLVSSIRRDIVKNLDTLMQQLTPAERMAWLEIYEKIHAYCDHSSNVQ